MLLIPSSVLEKYTPHRLLTYGPSWRIVLLGGKVANTIMISLQASSLSTLIIDEIRISVFRGYRVSLRRASLEFKSSEPNVVQVCFVNRAEFQTTTARPTSEGGSLP